jgi:hypothetical protein
LKPNFPISRTDVAFSGCARASTRFIHGSSGLQKPSVQERNALLEILEDRYNKHATLVTSQLHMNTWVMPRWLTPS